MSQSPRRARPETILGHNDNHQHQPPAPQESAVAVEPAPVQDTTPVQIPSQQPAAIAGPVADAVGTVHREVETVYQDDSGAKVKVKDRAQIDPRPNKPAKPRSAEEFMDAIRSGKIAGSYTCRRVTPPFVEYRKAMELSFSELVSALREYGEGMWKLQIYSDDNKMVVGPGGSEMITFDRKEAGEMKRINAAGEIVRDEAPADDDVDVKSMNRKIKLAKAKKELSEIEEESNRVQMGPVAQLQQEIKSLAERLEKSQQNNKPLDLIALLTVLAPIFTELMKSRSNGSELKEVIAVINAANEKQFAVLRELAMKKDDSSVDKLQSLVFKLVEQRASTDPMKATRELKKEIREEQEYYREMYAGRGDDDVEIDPNNIIGSLVAQGASALIRAFREGGPEIVTNIAAALHKPPQEVTNQDLVALAKQAPPQLTASNPALLPAPGKISQPQPVNAASQSSASGEGGTNADAAADIPPSSDEPPQVVSPHTQSEPATAELTVTDADLMEEVRNDVTEAIKTAIMDFRLKRKVLKWVEEALDFWPQSVLLKLCSTIDGDEWTKAIETLCDQTVWKQFASFMGQTDPDSPYKTTFHYTFFIGGVSQIVDRYKAEHPEHFSAPTPESGNAAQPPAPEPSTQPENKPAQ